MKLRVMDREGIAKDLEQPEGITLMEALRDSGVDEILALCGGGCCCATCHVYIEPGFEADLPEMSDDEAILLDTSDHRDERSRLSCQIRLLSSLDGLRITIAPEN